MGNRTKSSWRLDVAAGGEQAQDPDAQDGETFGHIDGLELRKLFEAGPPSTTGKTSL